jgi:hypothetical protein
MSPAVNQYGTALASHADDKCRHKDHNRLYSCTVNHYSASTYST